MNAAFVENNRKRRHLGFATRLNNSRVKPSTGFAARPLSTRVMAIVARNGDLEVRLLENFQRQGSESEVVANIEEDWAVRNSDDLRH
jgi:hypothetical protein